MGNLKGENILFDELTLELFTKIIQQDPVNIKVLFFVAQSEKQGKQVTVKTITDNIVMTRRQGVKDVQNNIVAFTEIKGTIDRKAAERIVDRLAYASLVYYEVQLPYKFIRLTMRGAQLAMKIHKEIGENKL